MFRRRFSIFQQRTQLPFQFVVSLSVTTRCNYSSTEGNEKTSSSSKLREAVVPPPLSAQQQSQSQSEPPLSPSLSLSSSSSRHQHQQQQQQQKQHHHPGPQHSPRNIYFVSQNGNYFFTDVAFSCIRNIRNTLVTAWSSSNHVAATPRTTDRSSKTGGTPEGSSAEEATTTSEDVSSSTTTSNSAQGPSASGGDVKVASQARNLHAYSPSNAFEAIARGHFGSIFFAQTHNNKKSSTTISTTTTTPHSPPSSTSASTATSSVTGGIYDEENQPPLPSSFGRRKWWYAMMPTGYPHSVSQGFARFFVLNLVGASLAAFSLTLATQALLSSFFAHGTSVGWLLKDILPAFLTAYLAHQFINVETHPREWFIVANMMTQGAVCFDFVIPFVAQSSLVVGTLSSYFEPQAILVCLAALSSFVKGLAMLILTTSRTALVQSFSREGNLVELSKRLHGMIVFIYPTASGVALALAALIGPNAVGTIAALVACCSIGVVSVSVMMVRNLYPRLLNVENATECCRRYLKGAPVVCAAEAPSVALFARRVYPVPFRVGFDLDSAIHRANRYGESIAVVSFANDFQNTKYLFVFRRPGKELLKKMQEQHRLEQQQQQKDHDEATGDTNSRSSSSAQGGEHAQYYTLTQLQQLQQQTENDIVTPRKFVGILFDVRATFSDVMEGLMAAVMFREHNDLFLLHHHHHQTHHSAASNTRLNRDNSSSSEDNQLSNNNNNTKNKNNNNTLASNLSNEYCHADLTDPFPLSRKKGNELLAKLGNLAGGGGNQNVASAAQQNDLLMMLAPPAPSSPRVFLKRPKPSDVAALVQQLGQAGWQTRPHQIDNRDFRIEIQQLTWTTTTPPSAFEQQQEQQQQEGEARDKYQCQERQTQEQQKQQQQQQQQEQQSASTISATAFSNLQQFGELNPNSSSDVNATTTAAAAVLNNTGAKTETKSSSTKQKQAAAPTRLPTQSTFMPLTSPAPENSDTQNLIVHPTDAVKPNKGQYKNGPNTNRKILKNAVGRIVEKVAARRKQRKSDKEMKMMKKHEGGQGATRQRSK